MIIGVGIICPRFFYVRIRRRIVSRTRANLWTKLGGDKLLVKIIK